MDGNSHDGLDAFDRGRVLAITRKVLALDHDPLQSDLAIFDARDPERVIGYVRVASCNGRRVRLHITGDSLLARRMDAKSHSPHMNTNVE